MDTSVVLAALGAVLTGAGGLFIVIYELRRRDRRQLRGTLEEIEADLYRVTQGYIAQRRYSFELRRQLADLGADSDPMPALPPKEPEP